MSGAVFDVVAQRYDADFTDRRLGRLLREQVYRDLEETFAPGEHVLDLGCGTGEDAVWLARRGVRVTALDASPAMLAVASAKAEREGSALPITFREVDLTADPPGIDGARGNGGEGGGALYDGAFSNFGALNCVPDLGGVAAELGRLVRPGGRLLLVLMGPFCGWETAGHLLRGRFGHAFRRQRRRPHARLGEGESFPLRYPSVRSLRRDLEPWFRLRGARAVGLFLPPSEFGDLVDRWPRTFDRLAALERTFSGVRPATWLSDHHLTIFERR